MPQSLQCVYVHLVFSTKERRPFIKDVALVSKYLAGIIHNVNGECIAVNGTADHMHILFALPANHSISKMVNLLKSNSS